MKTYLTVFPTMKSLGGSSDAKKADAPAQAAPVEAAPVAPVVEEVIDFSKVEIEPLFADCVDFDTFSKSDFRAVKVKECTAVLSAIHNEEGEEKLNLLMVSNKIPAGAKLY